MRCLPKSAFLLLTAVVATALSVLSVRAVLLHHAALSHSITQRLSAAVKSAPPAEIGDLLGGVKGADPSIKAVHLTNRWGVMLASTEAGSAVGRLPLEILLALSRSEEGTSTAETGSDIVRSVSILDDDGRIVGGILVVSTKSKQ